MTGSKQIGTDEMVARVRKAIAEHYYKRTGNASRLQELGVDAASVKRPAHRPAKTMFDDREIVQLVWSKKYLEGEIFSNVFGIEHNACLVAVAEAQDRHVSAVIRQWKLVPAAERAAIGKWLRELLQAEGLLHKRHKTK